MPCVFLEARASINTTLHVDVVVLVAGRIMYWAVGDLRRGLFVLGLAYVRELPVYEVPLGDVLSNIEHHLGILVMSSMKYFGSLDQVVPMGVDTDVRSMVSFVIASFVTAPMGLGIDLVLSDVPLDLCDPYGPGSFGSSSLLEVVPQVTIRSGLPVGVVAFPPEVVEDLIGPVHEGLAVSAYVDGAIGSKGCDGRGELGPRGAASVSPNWVYSMRPSGCCLQ